MADMGQVVRTTASAAGQQIDAAAVAEIVAIDDPITRNQRITHAYAELSTRLCLFTGGAFANWCTYAHWSSRSVGGAIACTALPVRAQQQLARLIPDSAVRRAIEARLQHGLPFTRQTVGVRLGEGNRGIFHEVATFVVQLLDAHEHDDHPRDDDLDALLASFVTIADDTMSPASIDDVREALRWYYRARFADSGKERSEFILLGSLLLGVYEQERVQRAIVEAFALGVDGLLRPLHNGVDHLPVPWPERCERAVLEPTRAWLIPRWSRLMTTRTMTLTIDDEVIALGVALAPEPGHPLNPATLDRIESPRLRDLLHELQLDDNRPVVARDWSSYPDRMRFIGAFFRSRQQDGNLFAPSDDRGVW